jgi:arylsulfatase A-like enzyme
MAMVLSPVTSVKAEDLPNVVVIFIDDLGYRDIGAFDAQRENGYSTPCLDRMAAEGMRFTDFVSGTAVCSASRAALLTGCYHRRVSIQGALGPGAKHGIHADEMTIAELVKQKGYATGIFGKWHLGHRRPFLPLQHGFDQYYGLPYSNDMWPFHPDYADLPADAARRKQGYPDLPLLEGNRIVNPQVTGEDQARLTTEYTERAVKFINDNRQRPFFLYVPHTMVHVPLFVSEKFRGQSKAGLFGDVMMEVDWSVGQILEALKTNGIDERTLVVFTSDNGPWLSYGNHAGSALPLREGKGTMFEGGYRVPTLMRWPGRIPAGSTCDELASTIDLLPTIAALTGCRPPDHKIDGRDIRPLMFAEPGARSPHEAFYCYYAGGQLQAVRDRRFKLHFPHRYRTMQGQPMGGDGKPGPYRQAEIGLQLFDLKQDIGETTDVAAEHPDVVSRLQGYAEMARDDLGDTLAGRKGSGVRPHGKWQESSD